MLWVLYRLASFLEFMWHCHSDRLSLQLFFQWVQFNFRFSLVDILIVIHIYIHILILGDLYGQNS